MRLSVVESFPDLKEKFILFNARIYSTRLTTLNQASFKWELQDVGPKSLLALDNEEIVGQIILFPAQCLYLNQKQNCVFAYDYIVDPNYLNTGVGVKLLSKTLKNNIHFGIGVSDMSRKLHLILKEKSIGNIYKYIFTRNLLSYFYAGINTYFKIDLRKLPSKVKFKQTIKINGLFGEKSDSIPPCNQAWNSDLIEFGRSKEFAQTRFYRFKSKYIYYNIFDDKHELQGYFVLRVEIWRGMRVLIISDYRSVKGNNDVANFICESTKMLMKENNLDAILFGSSLKWIDEILLKQKFKKVGIPSEILTNTPLEDNWERKSSERDLIMATPADSDFEFNLGNELWKN